VREDADTVADPRETHVVPILVGKIAMSPRICILIGALLGATGVAAGALGAHALQTRWPAEHLGTYEVAVRYQLWHALALVLVGLLLAVRPSLAAQVAAWAFVVGILLFSGGLYGWLFTQFRPLVHLVPLGGVTFLVGWLALARAGWSLSDRQRASL
jgi:uncharacterized membrane protein YgdD (TMEM256/DUF423 family)